MDMQNVAKLDIPEGEVRTIHDKDGNLIWGKVSYGVKYKGDTTQNGTPTPSAPAPVQAVTGENVVKISDGQGNEQSYPISLGSIELCKIGDYQDYIYKSGDKWYVRKVTQKIVLNGSESWATWNNKDGYIGFYWSNATLAKIGAESRINGALYCNMLSEVPTRYEIVQGSAEAIKQCGGAGDQYIAVGLALSRLSDTSTSAAAVQSFKTWLANNMPIVYATLATPTDTEITNEALVAQLENVEQWLTRYGYNATVSGNLPIIIDRTAL